MGCSEGSPLDPRTTPGLGAPAAVSKSLCITSDNHKAYLPLGIWEHRFQEPLLGSSLYSSVDRCAQSALGIADSQPWVGLRTSHPCCSRIHCKGSGGRSRHSRLGGCRVISFWGSEVGRPGTREGEGAPGLLMAHRAEDPGKCSAVPRAWVWPECLRPARQGEGAPGSVPMGNYTRRSRDGIARQISTLAGQAPEFECDFTPLH